MWEGKKGQQKSGEKSFDFDLICFISFRAYRGSRPTNQFRYRSLLGSLSHGAY